MEKLFRMAAVVFLVIGFAAGMESYISDTFDIPKPPYVTETKWFTQKIDHFSYGNNDYFQQQYLINDTWWNSNGGPIFLYTGNEGEIDSFAQNSGFMWDIAPEFSALLIFIEHRYYGKSLPYGPDATKPGHLKQSGFLSSGQALADFAVLLDDFKKNNTGSAKSPIIAFGGSYGGMLAAYFRIKYPHICEGAISASAPVNQFTTPCDAYGRIITSDFAANGHDCAETIRQSWAAIDNITSNDAGKKWLTDSWKLCEPLKTQKNVDDLKSYLSDVWSNTAMINYPYPADFLAPLPGNPIKAMCKGIMHGPISANLSEKQTVLAKTYNAVSVYFNYTGEAKCLKLSSSDNLGLDMWDFQECTEMQMPICYDNKNDMFEALPYNATQVSNDCFKKWGVRPIMGIGDVWYGGKHVEGASNIIFSNGLLDPWSSGGILKNVNPTIVAVVIPEGAHHLDLRAADPADPPSVIKARNIEKEHIQKWIIEAAERNGVSKKKTLQEVEALEEVNEIKKPFLPFKNFRLYN